MSTDQEAAADTLQRVYGDATQTQLDHQAAEAVMTTLRARGWIDLEEVATLVKAAGGRIEIGPDDHPEPNSKIVTWKQGIDTMVVAVR